MTPSILRVSNVSFIYSQGGEVLRDVSFDAVAGRITAILGPSGCGKSTLLNVVANVLSPRAGQVNWDSGEPVERVGYVFQSPSLVPWLTIEDNALFGVMLAGHGQVLPAQREEAREWLQRYGLGNNLRHYPAILSGGMQQRVALVRAVLPGASILLLDEPFSGTDFVLRQTLEDDICAQVEEKALAALLVTHDLEQAVRLADRIVVLGRSPATVAVTMEIQLSRAQRREPDKEILLEMHNHLIKLQNAIRATCALNSP